LKPAGILVLKFEVRPQFEWLGQRFYGELNKVFGRAPTSLWYFLSHGGSLFQGISNPNSIRVRARAAASFFSEFNETRGILV
jgi:hypothetical protein